MYQICQYAINKAQNGYLTPDEFNLLANQAQISYMDYLLGEFQQYQYGRPQARVNYSENSNTRQRIAPFIFETTLTVDVNGNSLYPSDYLQTDALRVALLKTKLFPTCVPISIWVIAVFTVLL